MKVKFKRLKPLFWLLFIGIVLVITTQLTMASVCDEENNNCSDWQGVWDYIYLPEYPDCPINFYYQYRNCIVDNIRVTEIQVYGFISPQPGIDDCDQFLEDQENGDFENGEFTGNFSAEIIMGAGLPIIEQHFMDAYNATAPENKWRFECGTGGGHQYQIVQQSCGSITYLTGYPDPQYPVGIAIVTPCEDNVCCRCDYFLCYQTGEHPYLFVDNLGCESVSGECSTETPEPVIPDFPFVVEIEETTDCMPLCEFP